MSHISASSNQSLAAQSEEDIQVLGETGQTVIYMFPNGRGWADRQTPDFDAFAEAIADSDVHQLDELVAAGKLTAAQKTVVLHDQETTGLSVEEILTARGWL